MAKVAGSGMMIVGGGTGDLVFSYSNPVLTVGTAAYPVTTMTFLSSSARITMGAAPSAGGAISIDAASYAGIAFKAMGTTVDLRILNSEPTFGTGIGLFSANSFNLFQGSEAKWRLSSTTASGVSELQSSQVTARIVGGSTNGLAIRNSGNTRDNFAIADAGTTARLSDGTRGATVGVGATVNERLVGARFSGTNATDNAWLISNEAGTSGIKAGVAYYNQSSWLSALEVTNTASGFGTLALMKSGGAVVIGTDPGGVSLLRIGGDMFANGSFTASASGTVGWNGRGFLLANSDGVFQLRNSAGTDFDRLQFGGTSASFPALQRSGTALLARLADNSAFTTFSMGQGWFNTAATAPSAGVLAIGGTQQTTIGANGAASALTANPLGYIKGFIGSTAIIIPYYNA